jgi:hypothetical protein
MADLTERERVALLALASETEPISGGVLAKKMMAAGRNTTRVAAYQAAHALRRKGLAYRHQPYEWSALKFGITEDGREAAARLARENAGEK